MTNFNQDGDMFAISRTILTVCLMMGFCSLSSAASYYLDNTVASVGNGTSPATAWKNLTDLNGRSFTAGDSIKFKCGGTWKGQLKADGSGIKGQSIVYTSYGTGNKPVITNPTGQNIVSVTGKYIVVEGLKFDSGATQSVGILTSANSSYCILQNCEIAHTAQGAGISGSHHCITRSYIHDLHMIHDDPGGDDDYGAEGIVFSSASDIEVSFNRIVNCVGHSFDYGQDGGAFEIWQAASRVSIHHNYIQNCCGVLEGGGTGEVVSDFTISYNMLIAKCSEWLGIHTSDKFSVVPRNFKLDNNTIVSCGSVWAAGVWLTMTNNIFYNSSGGGISGGHNLGWGNTATDIKGKDPMFINPSSGDYHLKNGSPAIDAGTDLGYSLDFDEKAVPYGTAPDIGALEYHGSRMLFVPTEGGKNINVFYPIQNKINGSVVFRSILHNKKPIRFTVFNITGALIQNIMSQGNEDEISTIVFDRHHYSAGFYPVRIETDGFCEKNIVMNIR